MDKLKAEEDKLDLESEETHGDYEKMKLVFEKRIKVYGRFLKIEGLSELDRLRLENKKEWHMSHLLNLIIEQELRDRNIDLTKRMHGLEKAAQLE